MDDRIPLRKEHNLRWAANLVATIGPANQAAACKFLDWKIHNDRRRSASFRGYSQIAKNLDIVLAGKPYAAMTHEDGDRYVAHRLKTCKHDTLQNELGCVRHFLKWQLREAGQVDLTDLPYRLKMSLTIRRESRRSVKREKPLTREEFEALLAIRKDDPCTQALYWLCYDGGIRIGEALVLNVQDFDLQADGGAVLRIPDVEGYTKTHDREPYVLECLPALKTWLDLHPMDAAPDAPLFTSLIRPFRRCTYEAISSRLTRDLNAAGLRQNIHLHLFRKTSATRRVRTMDPDEFRAFHGWSPGSKVASQYVMDSKEQARAAIRREQGLSETGLPVKPVEVGMKSCPSCAEDIKAAAVKCKHCGEMVAATRLGQIDGVSGRRLP